MKMNSLEDLLKEQLQDLYSAEQQIIKALPKMAEAASSSELRRAFEEHLKETEDQKRRLEELFEEFELDSGKKCVGMEGLLKEGQELMKEKGIDANVLDAGLIAAAQKVEHYEIASYGTVRTFAHELGYDDAASVLDEILQEESKTNEKLTRLAERSINKKAS
jgi:ferritin-like metal-binding protein YciE